MPQKLFDRTLATVRLVTAYQRDFVMNTEPGIKFSDSLGHHCGTRVANKFVEESERTEVLEEGACQCFSTVVLSRVDLRKMGEKLS